MADKIKLNASVPSGKISTGVSKSSVKVDVDQRVVVPRLEDYFEWRQQTFDPLYHWPLTDGEGATELHEATGGPPAIPTALVQMGAKSIVRPTNRYSSARIAKNVGASQYIEVVDSDTNFVQRTGVFTVACWVKPEQAGADYVVGTGGPESNHPPGWSLYFAGHLNRVFFALYDGVSSTSYSFLRGDTDRTRVDVEEGLSHIVVVGDGKRIKVYLDGASVWTDGETDFTPVLEDAPTSLKFMNATGNNRITRGRIQGVLIDDKPWSKAEIQADYDRGISAVEVAPFALDPAHQGEGDFDDLVNEDLLVSYQFKYPIYNGERLLFREEGTPGAPVPTEPVVAIGDNLGMVLPHAGDGPRGLAVSKGTRRIWNGEGVESPEIDGMIEFGEIGDFDFIHSGTARLIIDIYVDPSDDNRRTLAFTRSAGSHTGFWWSYESNDNRMGWNLSGAPETVYSSNLGITEPGFYRLEVRANSEETQFYVDGEFISSSPVVHDLDQGVATRELRIGANGFGLAGYEREIRSFSVYTGF